jgi:hypothetical protein
LSLGHSHGWQGASLTSIERMRRIKLIGLVALLALPYCFWVGSDYSDRIEPWIGLIIFVGYLIFVNLVVLILWKRMHKPSASR